MSKQKVLIVDDLEENIHVVSSIISSPNISIIIAKDGETALKVARVKLPDLILLDISMPGMDGYEVCEELKSKDDTKDIPVVFLTALSQSSEIVKGFNVGAIDYITKPFNIAELVSRVNTHLELTKNRNIILQQNIELQKEIEQRKLAAQQLEIKKEELEIKNKEIMSSINYARMIQKAVLPSHDFLKCYLPEHFILNLPRDIVSGDFYWTRHIENKIIVAAADCTGHGIPGAFMSMLGVGSLNEIVNNYKKTDKLNAANILNLLRNHIKLSLHQDRVQNTVTDGMDISLCIIDIENKTLEFAGANHSLYLVRNAQDNTAHLIEYKGDRMPIAVYLKEYPFTSKTVELQNNDVLYLFSDGYKDQFGGEKNTKFLNKNFKKLLLKISNLPAKEQKKILLDRFNEWKGTHDQVDDVLVIGLKIAD